MAMGDNKAYVLAKSRNMYEDWKLNLFMKQMEKEFRQNASLMNSGLLEERRVASLLKRQSKEIEKKQKRLQELKRKARGAMKANRGTMELFTRKKVSDDLLELPRDYKMPGAISSKHAEMLEEKKEADEEAKQNRKKDRLPPIDREERKRKLEKEKNRSKTIAGYHVDIAGTANTKNASIKFPPVWPGDPNAIASVRRDRKSVTEISKELMSRINMTKTNLELLQLQTCSKNCQRKFALEDSLKSPQDTPLTMSQIRKRNVELRRGNKLSKSTGDLPDVITSDPIESVKLAQDNNLVLPAITITSDKHPDKSPPIAENA